MKNLPLLYIILFFLCIKVFPCEEKKISSLFQVENSLFFNPFWEVYFSDIPLESKKKIFILKSEELVKKIKIYDPLYKIDLEKMYEKLFYQVDMFMEIKFFDSVENLIAPFLKTKAGRKYIKHEAINYGTQQIEDEKISLQAKLNLIELLKNNPTKMEEIKNILSSLQNIENNISRLEPYIIEKFDSYTKSDPSIISKFLGKYKDLNSFPMLIFLSQSIYTKKIIDLKKQLDSSEELRNGYKVKSNFKTDNDYNLFFKEMEIKYIPLKSMNVIVGINPLKSTYYSFKDIFLNKKNEMLLFHKFVIFGTASALNSAIIYYGSYPFFKKRYETYYLGKLFSLYSEKIALVKKLYSVIKDLYKKNGLEENKNKTLEWNALSSEGTSFGLNFHYKAEINKIESIGSGKMQYLQKTVMQIMPGLYAGYFLKTVKENIVFEILDRFVGSIDAAVAKADLLKSRDDVCTPLIDFNANNAVNLTISDMWSPGIKNSVKNSISFDSSQQGIVAVSPIAAGKTVFLSSFLCSIYFSSIGIAPAKYLKLPYFYFVCQKIKESYDIGSGLSKGLSELKDMKEMIKLVNKTDDPMIIFVDELFSGMNHQDALFYAKEYISLLLQKKNVIFIFTTHIPDFADYILDLITKKKAPIGYYYFNINVDPMEVNFSPTFKLVKDLNGEDPNNWYLRDPILRRKYNESRLNNLKK